MCIRDRDMANLDVYTFQGDQILEHTFVDFTKFKVGTHEVCIRIDFIQTTMNGCMSMFFNDDYGYDFDFEYENIYKCAEIPVPVKDLRLVQYPQLLANIISPSIGEMFVSSGQPPAQQLSLIHI